MRRSAATWSVVVTFVISNITYAQMGPGPVDVGQGAACYNPATGEIIVSMNAVNSWFIESFSESLSGATPILPSAGALVTDNDGAIGETDFVFGLTFTDHNLGPVAALGLPLSDLIIAWYPSLGGSPPIYAPVTLCVPEPTAVTLVLVGAALFRRKFKGRQV